MDDDTPKIGDTPKMGRIRVGTLSSLRYRYNAEGKPEPYYPEPEILYREVEIPYVCHDGRICIGDDVYLRFEVSPEELAFLDHVMRANEGDD